jgi:hypothetical protein
MYLGFSFNYLRLLVDTHMSSSSLIYHDKLKLKQPSIDEYVIRSGTFDWFLPIDDIRNVTTTKARTYCGLWSIRST